MGLSSDFNLWNLKLMKLAIRLIEPKLDNNRKLALSNGARKRIAEALR